jgi:hypothetical protein
MPLSKLREAYDLSEVSLDQWEHGKG